MMVLDFYLPHCDALLRTGVVVSARPDDTYLRLKGFDFAPVCASAGRAIEDMRAVPRSIAEVARQARSVPATTTFLLQDAVRRGFVPLSDDPGGHIVLGGVGKLWRPRIELLPLDREEFLSFHEAKYVKAVFGFVLKRYGKDRTTLRYESRFLGTDDSARTHFRRFWPVAEPFAAFFMQRALRSLAEAVAEEREAAAAPPPWRQ